MNWFVYLVKTTWVQKKQDWFEFRTLKQDLRRAQANLDYAKIHVSRTFFEEDSYDEVHACLKKRVMYGRAKPIDSAEFEYMLKIYDNARCTKFVPIDDEQLCPCKQCGAYPANKYYFDMLQELKRISNKRNNFWKNKFSQKIK